MEVAVASSSALGQYLSDLDAQGDGNGESMARLLSAPRPVARKRSRRKQWANVSNAYTWLQWLRRRVEVATMRRLIPELCAFHPTIREELQLAAYCDPAVLIAPSMAHGSWWQRHVVSVEVLSGVNVVIPEHIRGFVALAGGALVAIITIKLAGQDDVLLQALGWIMAVATSALLSLELCVRVLLAWYVYRSKRFVKSLNAFVAALKDLNEIFTRSLTLIKRAELASRGYRLGTGLLPPIGRLEAANSITGKDKASPESAVVLAVQKQLRCLPLRRKLSAVNEQLQVLASKLGKEGEHLVGDETQDCVQEKAAVDEQAPSLLLTVLTKQHNRAVLLLENAVHVLLVRNIACACSSRNDVGLRSSLLRTLVLQRLTVEQLNGTLSAWMKDLEAWNIAEDPMLLPTRAPSSKQQPKEQHVSSVDANSVHLKGVALQLRELRSRSETLTALVVAAQYDLLSADLAAERLGSSRDVMCSIALRLQEAWNDYDSALSALAKRKEKPEDAVECAVEDDERCDDDSEPIVSRDFPCVAASEDPNCTIVFTGTSTGDEGFDLQMLLKQQAEGAASTFPDPTPRFIHELQDVLAHRQTQGTTKQVDHDPSVVSTSAPPPPAANAIFALPRAPRHRRPPSVIPARSEATASAFNLELQALLQRNPTTQHHVVECQGDNEDDATVKAKTGELLTIPSRNH